MKYLFYLLLGLTFSLQAQSTKNQFPDYLTVKRKLCSQYKLDSDAYFHLEKRKEGWVLVKLSYKDERMVQTKWDLFWSAKEQNYLALKYPYAKYKDEKCAKDLEKSNWELAYFRVSPYFGYEKWSNDMIADYGNKENLSDSMLYVLARAYSERSTNLFSGQYYSEGKAEWTLPEGNNAFTSEQLKTYLDLREKVYETYQKLEKIKPNFQTIVGSVHTKYSNEHATTFWDLCMFQNEKEAAKSFNKPLYCDAIIAYAKNVLNSCDSNAILITNGDNDSYPLLYAQSYLGIRKDVLVANMSLMNLPRFLEMLKRGLMEAKPAPISWDNEKIREANSFIQLNQNKEDVLPFSALVENIQEMKMQIDACKFYFLTEKKDTILIDLSRKYYLLLADVMMLEMIAQGGGKRPICFANTLNYNSMEHLKPYLALDGFVYKMADSIQVPNTDYLKMKIMNAHHFDVEKNYEKYTQVFDWAGTERLGYEAFNLAEMYLQNVAQLALGLIHKEENEKALALIEKSYQRIHGGGLKTISSDVLLLQVYYETDEIEKGNILAKKILKDIESHNLAQNPEPFSESQSAAESHTKEMLEYFVAEYKQTKAVFGK